MSDEETSEPEERYCSCCPNLLPEDYDGKTCQVCRDRSAENRAKAKEKQITCAGTVASTGDACTSKVHPDCGDMFCKKHESQWITYQDGEGVRRCTAEHTSCYPDDPSKAGIKAILPLDYKYKHCETCRKQRRIKENQRRNNKQQEGDKLKNSGSDLRICPKCPCWVRHHVEDMGVTSNGKESRLCKKHLQQSRTVEKNRPKRNRKTSYSRYEKRKYVKIRRKVWRQNNRHKTYKYYTGYRARKRNENLEEYKKKVREYARKYRKLHPDKMKKIYENNKYNINRIYGIYLWRADRDGYDFDLTIDEVFRLINSTCYYCDCEPVDRLQGLDRLDNKIGYVEDNVVPCCKTCNMMKNTYNEATFILMCAHIATYKKFVKIGKYSYIFNDYVSDTYSECKNNAKTWRSIEFKLTEQEFDDIKSGICYLCGRKSSVVHTNGIDRVRNTEGYIVSNCACCCGDCNYLKKDQDLFDFIIQCGIIAKCHSDRLVYLLGVWRPSKCMQRNPNKIRLTPEEKEERKKQRDADRDKRTAERYTSEAIHAESEKIRKENEQKIVIEI